MLQNKLIQSSVTKRHKTINFIFYHFHEKYWAICKSAISRMPEREM